MRGKARSVCTYFHRLRITPAYAGKSDVVPDHFEITWDHPRLCGEKVISSDVAKRYAGSPPPMRGKAGKSIDKRHKSGITPAYAGKSPQTAVLFLRRSGSPPPMRGKGFQTFRKNGTSGITPAYAGKRGHLMK